MYNKYRILIVDDSIEWLKSHQDMLKNLFPDSIFEIDTATSARKGVEKVLLNSQNPYDLIIVDLEMERIMDEVYAGAWLIKNLINREELKNTKFLIISSAYNILDIAERFKVSYIHKSTLIQNPLAMKYKIEELLGIESC